MLGECDCDAFFIRQYARPVPRKLTDIARQNDFALQVQGVGDVEPTAENGLAGFNQTTSCRIVK